MSSVVACDRCKRAIPSYAPRHYMCDQVFCTLTCRLLSAADVLTERAEQLQAARASANDRQRYEQGGASRLHAAGPIGPTLAQALQQKRSGHEQV